MAARFREEGRGSDFNASSRKGWKTKGPTCKTEDLSGCEKEGRRRRQEVDTSRRTTVTRNEVRTVVKRRDEGWLKRSGGEVRDGASFFSGY